MQPIEDAQKELQKEILSTKNKHIENYVSKIQIFQLFLFFIERNLSLFQFFLLTNFKPMQSMHFNTSHLQDLNPFEVNL